MATELITCSDFDPFIIQDTFEARGWVAELVKASNADLVKTDEGAAAECGDDEFDKLVKRKKYGPRILGGIFEIAALKTGGGRYGLLCAAEDLRRIGIAPGTHDRGDDDCGALKLWRNGDLLSAIHAFTLHHDLAREFGHLASEFTHQLHEFMEQLGGKHFHLANKPHGAEALRWNPFTGTTERSSEGDRVRNDDWVPSVIGGISLAERIHFNAETVEKLHLPKKVEILIP